MVCLGGVFIFFGSLVVLLVVWNFGVFGVMSIKGEWEVWGVVLGGLVFFGIGLFDDLFDLSFFFCLLV